MSMGIGCTIGNAPAGEWGDWYRIRGTLSRVLVPGAYRVRLFTKREGLCLRETWSDAAGAYEFRRLALVPQGYFVVVNDHSAHPCNARIADLVTPEPMP